jgi:hypothetical protein
MCRTYAIIMLSNRSVSYHMGTVISEIINKDIQFSRHHYVSDIKVL